MSLDLPGFADPVRDAQSCFRSVLDAMARPGTLHRAGTGLTPPAPLDAATSAVLLTLVDADTPLWLAPDCMAAREWLAFHCGAHFASNIGAAAFVVATTLPAFSSLDAGSDDGPDESATVILQVGGFGMGRALRLAGPGLRVPATFCVDGLPDDFVAQWQENHALYPRGVDVILCSGDTLAALPRSLKISEG
jgi:alpha-D-ribose 1-methylphosphonate 5-triphosphate synthase subunit PhnH